MNEKIKAKLQKHYKVEEIIEPPEEVDTAYVVNMTIEQFEEYLEKMPIFVRLYYKETPEDPSFQIYAYNSHDNVLVRVLKNEWRNTRRRD